MDSKVGLSQLHGLAKPRYARTRRFSGFDRIDSNDDGRDNHLILESIGHGHYVGCLLSVDSLRRSPDWERYGEGDDVIFLESGSVERFSATSREPLSGR